MRRDSLYVAALRTGLTIPQVDALIAAYRDELKKARKGRYAKAEELRRTESIGGRA